MSCPNKCGASIVIVRDSAIEKGKRVYYCYEHCTKCGHVFRSWKEG